MPYLSQIEHDHVLPRPEKLEAVAKAFGVDVQDLLDEREKKELVERYGLDDGVAEVVLSLNRLDPERREFLVRSFRGLLDVLPAEGGIPDSEEARTTSAQRRPRVVDPQLARLSLGERTRLATGLERLTDALRIQPEEASLEPEGEIVASHSKEDVALERVGERVATREDTENETAFEHSSEASRELGGNAKGRVR